MPLGVATKTLGDVIAYTKRQFGDESGVQITDADITRWTNQGCMEIVNKNPMIQATANQDSVQYQQTYPVPPDIIQIESVMFDGNILQPRNFERIRAELGTANTTQQGTPEFWYTWADLIYLWPVPTTVKVISVNYSKTPRVVTSPADLLELPDRYFDRVCEYVNSKAYELDEDWQGHQVNRQSFEDKLTEETNAQTNMIGELWVATDSEYEW
jgi:hypothetical protein